MRYGALFLIALGALAQINRPGKDVSREGLSDMASRMLERTVQARAALDKGDRAAARHDVEEALQNVTAMEIARPKAAQPFMVTLYTESVEIAVAQPQQPGAPGAGQGAANRSQEVPVQQVTGESTRVAVDVTQAKQHLTAAKNAIDAGDLGVARESLAAVDTDLKAESAVGDLPLIKARENLRLALDDVRQQQFSDAVAPLRAASAGLGEYGQSHEPHAKDAAKLRSQVDALAGSIEQDHSRAEPKIAEWWREITWWIKPLEPPAVRK